MNKKAISPLISVLLIIVVSFILILVYSLWASNIIITTTEETEVELGSYLECQQLKFFEKSCDLEINDVNYSIDNISLVLENLSSLDLKNINVSIHGTDNYFENISSYGKLQGTVKKGQIKAYNTKEDFEWKSGINLSNFYTINKITVVSEVCPDRIVTIEGCYYGKEFCDNPSTPSFSKVGGVYPDYYDLTISLSSSCLLETDYKIYYTIDGTTPTEESIEYTEPIEITDLGETTIKAVVYAPQSDFTMGISPVREEVYYVGGSAPLNGEIYYLEHLAYIDTNSTTLSGTYYLMRDLDFQDSDSYYDSDNMELWTEGEGWEPVGKSPDNFRGSLDGKDNIIKNLYINRPSESRQGLFGYIWVSGPIENLHLREVNVIGDNFVGPLVGRNDASTIRNCSSSGIIIGNGYVGGLVGYNAWGGWVYNNYSFSEVKGNNRTGGLIGQQHRSTSYNNYSTGDVFRLDGTATNIGGLIGLNTGGTTNSTIRDSYSIGKIYYQDGYENPIDKGFVGDDDVNTTYINNFFDINSSNQQTSIGALGRTTEQMQKLISYSTSLEFDGENNYVEIPHDNSLVHATTMSWSFWVKRKESDHTELGGFISKYDTSNNQRGWVIREGITGNPSGISGNISPDGTSQSAWNSPSGVLLDDEWTHVVVTYSAGEINIYSNGIHHSTVAALTSIYNNDLLSVRIGQYHLNTVHTKSKLYDVRIYNKALTSQEVEDLYNKQHVSDGLIGWWPFNEAEGNIVYDYSGNDNHGILSPDYPTNSPIWVEDSPLAWDILKKTDLDNLVGQSALSFDGVNNYIGNINVNLKNAPWSASVWAKVSKDVLNTSNHYTVLSQGYYKNGGWWVYYRDDSKSWSFWLDDGVNTSIISGLGQETVEEWVHITINYDVNNEFNLYMNGVFMGANVFEIGDTVESFVIGGRKSGTDRLFSGKIDEVRIYNRALSEPEIQQLYNKQHVSDGLVGHWRLDEKKGNVAYDSSGNNNHGTIHGASWYPTWYIDENNDYPRLTWTLNN